MTKNTSGYAPINGMQMYYEVHGTGHPVVLLHGTFSGIGTSFGAILPHLAKTRQAIGVEFQGHARTADIDRPLSSELLADDVIALLDHLGIARADLLGYSLGADVALRVARKRPDLVRKLVLISVEFAPDGLHGGLGEGFTQIEPEHLHGSPFHDEYVRLAPRPDDFPVLVEKVNEFGRNLDYLTPEEIKALAPPVLLVIGDSDIIRPEHTVEIFRLLGGGVVGDLEGLPKSRLAVLPGSTHVTVMHRAEWLASMVDDFLDAERPTA